ncbi:hypothetical protein SAMD00019534_004770 [Acytostelium subglobosum LB1]|uniref:hypothetical protein n=1 Tax=Acytostelium subglobosum LB1 TaxID=1410327 RepID=UPI000644B57F|nr:hypothetical protein SAMD00019534_004770 [Acytostelium subglobosum LB1]GAM17302.1 hypothetical protein SAMD00019534_004770 [Acytostelium subglobosum LB1]|eukprot:XP_012759364.1 hypothetical protein SAMD00019534_004770 [Acytostelium subglobosum LB1]
MDDDDMTDNTYLKFQQLQQQQQQQLHQQSQQTTLPELHDIKPNVRQWNEAHLLELHAIYNHLAQPLIDKLESELKRPDWKFLSQKEDSYCFVRPTNTPTSINLIVTSTFDCPPKVCTDYISKWSNRREWDRFNGEVSDIHYFTTNKPELAAKYGVPFNEKYEVMMAHVVTCGKMWSKLREVIMLQVSGVHPTQPGSMMNIARSVPFSGIPVRPDLVRLYCPLWAYYFESLDGGERSKVTHVVSFEFNKDTSSASEVHVAPDIAKVAVIHGFEKVAIIGEKTLAYYKRLQQGQESGDRVDKPLGHRGTNYFIQKDMAPIPSPFVDQAGSEQTTPPDSGTPQASSEQARVRLTFSNVPDQWVHHVLLHEKDYRLSTLVQPFDNMRIQFGHFHSCKDKLMFKATFNVSYSLYKMSNLLLAKHLRWDPLIHSYEHVLKGTILVGGGPNAPRDLMGHRLPLVPTYRIQSIFHIGFMDNKYYYLEERDTGDIVLFILTSSSDDTLNPTTKVDWYFLISPENWYNKLGDCQWWPMDEAQQRGGSIKQIQMTNQGEVGLNPNRQAGVGVDPGIHPESFKLTDFFVHVYGNVNKRLEKDWTVEMEALEALSKISLDEKMNLSPITLDAEASQRKHRKDQDYDDEDSDEESKIKKKQRAASVEPKAFTPDSSTASKSVLLPPWLPSALPFVGQSLQSMETPPDHSNMMSLPTELLYLIISYVSCADLSRLASVCKQLKQAAENDGLWYSLYVKSFGKCCHKDCPLDAQLPHNENIWSRFSAKTLLRQPEDPMDNTPASDVVGFLTSAKKNKHKTIDDGSWKSKFYLKTKMEALWTMCKREHPCSSTPTFNYGPFSAMSINDTLCCRVSPSMLAFIPNNKDDLITSTYLFHDTAFFSTNRGDYYKINLSNFINENFINRPVSIGPDRDSKGGSLTQVDQARNDDADDDDDNNDEDTDEHIIDDHDALPQTVSLWMDQRNVLNSLLSNRVLYRYNVETTQTESERSLVNPSVPLQLWDVAGAAPSYNGDRVAMHYRPSSDEQQQNQQVCDNLIDIFDVDTCQLLTTYDKHERVTCTNLKFNNLLAGDATGVLDLVDCHTGRQTMALTPHDQAVLCCGLLNDEHLAISSAADNTLRLYDTRTGPNAMKRLHTDSPVSAFDVAPRRLVCATSTCISYWDPRNLNKAIGELWSPPSTDIVTVQMSQFNVLVLYSNGISHIWDFHNY